MSKPGWLRSLAGLGVSAGVFCFSWVGLRKPGKLDPGTAEHIVPPGSPGPIELPMGGAIAGRHPASAPIRPVVAAEGSMESQPERAFAPGPKTDLDRSPDRSGRNSAMPGRVPSSLSTIREVPVGEAVARRHPSSIEAEIEFAPAASQPDVRGDRMRGSSAEVARRKDPNLPGVATRTGAYALDALPGSSIADAPAPGRPSPDPSTFRGEPSSGPSTPLAFQAIPAMTVAELAAWKSSMAQSRTLPSTPPSPIAADPVIQGSDRGPIGPSTERLEDIGPHGRDDGLVEVTISERSEWEGESRAQPATGAHPGLDVLSSFRLGPGEKVASTTSATANPGAGSMVRKDGGAGCWIPWRTTVIVAGIEIRGGMIHVGKSLPGSRGWETDACLINPSLPAGDNGQAGIEGIGPSWANYAALSPPRRRGFLQWLAGERMISGDDLIYPSLYFRGLERRLFHDHARDEQELLTAEVDRLASAIKGDDPLRTAMANFLTASALMGGGAPPLPEPMALQDWQFETPLATLVHLGLALHEARPFLADDALLWVLGLPGAHLRTPGKRCFAEMRALFGARFGERHPGGLKVRSPKRRLSATYRAYGDAFAVAIPDARQDLPDISAVTAPLQALKDLLEACQKDLEGYSRFIGRKPGAATTFEAASLLPPPLGDGILKAVLASGKEAIGKLIPGNRIEMIAPATLMAAVGLDPLPRDGSFPGASLNQLTRRLDLLGFGVEPDRRYGGRASKVGSSLALFHAADGAPVNVDRPEYAAAKTMIEIGVLAAAADGHVSDRKFDAVLHDLHVRAELSEGEIARLSAVARVSRERAKPGALPGKLAGLAIATREAIARTAVTIVLADGQPTKAEVAFLEKLLPMLGLPAEAVHGMLHQGPGGAVGGARTHTHGKALDLDRIRIARVRSETADISAVLAHIFTEEDVLPTEKSRTIGSNGMSRFEGLDEAHGSLLEALSKGGMPRENFTARAKGVGLLPDGAIETINDWGFDAVGDAILEDDGDLVSIVAEHLQTVVEARKPA